MREIKLNEIQIISGGSVDYGPPLLLMAGLGVTIAIQSAFETTPELCTSLENIAECASTLVKHSVAGLTSGFVLTGLAASILG